MSKRKKIAATMSASTLKRRIKVILNDVSRLVEDKSFFQEYQTFIANHPTINKNNQFLYFIGLNYIEAATLGVFRQIDGNRKSQSLLNLLRDIDASYKLFSYRRFSAKYSMPGMAESQFQQFAIKDGSRIDKGKIRKDIAGLLRVTKPILKYRHKVVAHKNKRQVSINGTINDLYKAIDFIENMVIKYHLLLTQGGMSTLQAGNSYPNLQEIFK
jgi:hypothetical protein